MQCDKKYYRLVHPILEHEEFDKMKKIEHHGVSRYSHSLKVSYYSYKMAKLLKLDYISVARAGLLHDFFWSDPNRSKKERFISTFVHPKKAVGNACELFTLNEKEKDMIRTHMFPINIAIPKYAESWIVSIVDKGVGMFEFTQTFCYKICTKPNISFLFLLSLLRI